MRYQRGQSMAEYLVVAGAFFTAFFWAANADCPGYDNCIDKLKTVMHDKYEGYSHSISAVHQYGDFEGEGFEGSWVDDGSSSPGEGGGSSGEIDEQEGLVKTDQIVSTDGTLTYGILSDGTTVVDEDGNEIGTYNSETGVITFTDGTQADAVVNTVVTDEDGDPAELQAVVDCITGVVYGFGYESGVTGDFYNSLTLDEMDISGYCLAPTYGVVDTAGDPMTGAIVGAYYYASTLTNEVDRGSPQTPAGEVVYFDIEVPDETIYDDSDPGIGERVDDCSVMVSSWDADPDAEELDLYLNSDPSPRLGSLDPDAGIPCPSLKEVTD